MAVDTTRNSDKLPWKDEINNTLWYKAYRELDEHGKVSRYIFAIKDKNGSGLPYAVHSCLLLATTHRAMDGWDSYSINIPFGPAAGQEVDQYYVELKPVRDSDVG